ncbi:MAG TPA: hypothetical protein PLQ93_00880 [Bacteroidia bacterium]|nr:hypothetical protein [Bacteroidia bacterium]
MYPLSEKQIDFILNDIRARGVEMEDLQYNLLDHICCIIEQNLGENGDFEAFYNKTIRSFYKKELWEIEEETISLIIFKNYYTMKKIMLYSGISSAALVVAGIILKFLHLPGASAMLVLGVSLSSLIFLPMLFILKIKERQSSRDKLILGLGTLSAMALSLGILFKVMHWPFANILGLSSVLILVVLFLPIYFFTGIRNPDTKVNTIVSSMLLIIGCGLFMALIRAPRGSLLLKIRDTQDYLNTQRILENERKLKVHYTKTDTASALNTLTVKIDRNCESIKAFILQMQIGSGRLPADFEKNERYIEEGSLGYHPFLSDSPAYGDYQTLCQAIREYNILAGTSGIALTKIQTTNTFIDHLENSNFSLVTYLGILNELTQIQMLVLQNQGLQKAE